ncbi:MAG: glycosyltransferase [Caulobacteraceae bacterium]
MSDLTRDLLISDEFSLRIEAPLLNGDPASIDEAVIPSIAELAAWAARTLPLEEPTKRATLAVRSWYVLLAGVLADRSFRDFIGKERLAAGLDELVAALSARAKDSLRLELIGSIEHADARRVSGWALNLVEPTEALTLQLFADGRFVALGRTGHFRRDLQEIHGGDGRFGFAIDYAVARDDDRPRLEMEVREAGSGVRLGRITVERDPQLHLDALMVLRREIGQVKEALARIERMLPETRGSASFSLASYGEYWERVYARPPSPGTLDSSEGGSVLFSIVLLASGDPGGLRRELEAIAGQSHARWELTVVAGDSTATETFRAAFEQHAKTSPGPMRLRLFGDGTPVSEMRNAAARAANGDYIVLIGEGLPASDALAALARRAPAAPALIYADGDEIVRDAGGEVHVSPRLLPDFDHDLLLQSAYFGDLVAIRSELFRSLGGFRAEFETVQDHDLWLRVSEQANPADIVHVPRVLHHRIGSTADPHDSAQEDFQRCVGQHLQRIGRPSRVSAHRDLLGYPLPLTARIEARDLSGRTARVIIPTRDRVDLVEACLASLERTRPANAVSFEVVVVDNESDPATSGAVLAAMAAEGRFRLLAHPGAFNWAAINNAAARDCTTDVLIFLNNDTVALSADWCDSLCGHALRADVGAVGARLIYEDGTIQHVGMVLTRDGWPTHEGVGVAGSSGGYLARHALVRQCVSVTGACMAARTDLFQSLGGFDEKTFATTYNDVDWCLRVRAEGLKALYDPYAVFHHLEAKSRGYDTTPERRNRARREEEAFRAKWAGSLDYDPFYNPHFERFAPPFTRLAPPPPI